uniref:Uncharacterized protein n=1 Tax=Sphaeramia orbicularis TaxID=375764 RepID=A0A672ZYA6_9TELE
MFIPAFIYAPAFCILIIFLLLLTYFHFPSYLTVNFPFSFILSAFFFEMEGDRKVESGGEIKAERMKETAQLTTTEKQQKKQRNGGSFS